MAFAIPSALILPRSEDLPLLQHNSPWPSRLFCTTSITCSCCSNRNRSPCHGLAPHLSTRNPRSSFVMASSSSSSSSSSATQSPVANAGDAKKKRRAINIYEEDANVVQVHTIKEFEDALVAAKDKLVVVEYAASHSASSRRIYPAMVELSLTCQDAVFILVMGDESDDTKELCRRAGIEKVPHFTFYKNGEIIHEEEGISAEDLLGDVLYYGDPADNPIVQLHSRQEMEELIDRHAQDDKLLVVDVGLKHCGPCVKVYPTVLKLARKMRDTVVFARIHGDENDDLTELLRKMDVVQVPTFLFIRDKKPLGRYVGSGKGELIGEILRYQGVRVTY